jgi:hypothetical protein
MYDSFTFQSKKPAGVAGDPPTTDNFADIEISAAHQGYQTSPLIAPSSGPISLNWKNTGANSIQSRVLGSNDVALADADWEVVAADAAIAAAASRHITINPAVYQFYKFQHKATGAGSQGASQIRGAQKRI